MSESIKGTITNVLLVLAIVAGTCTAVTIVTNEVLERSCRTFGVENQVEVNWVSHEFMLWGQCLVETSSGEWSPRP